MTSRVLPGADQLRGAEARGFAPCKPATKASASVVNGEELGTLLGVTSRTIRTLTTEGILTRGPDGYDLAASIQGFVAYKVAQAEAGGRRPGSSSLAAEREREIRERADHMAMRNAQMRAELVPVAEVEARWADMLRGVRARILAVPGRVQQRLGHLTAHDVATLDREVRDALTEASHGNGA